MVRRGLKGLKERVEEAGKRIEGVVQRKGWKGLEDRFEGVRLVKDAGGEGRRGGLEERVEGARGEKEREEEKKR